METPDITLQSALQPRWRMPNSRLRCPSKFFNPAPEKPAWDSLQILCFHFNRAKSRDFANYSYYLSAITRGRHELPPRGT